MQCLQRFYLNGRIKHTEESVVDENSVNAINVIKSG